MAPTQQSGSLPETQRAVRWHPPAYDIRIETVPTPTILDPDDAIVKVKLAGLCGSDLHIYRGHEDVGSVLTGGHEFVGEVVALGSNFGPGATGRPELYSTLRVGDMVISPFTITCGECHFCRIGATCRCVHSQLFGTPALPGGQAQYVRVAKAGGTLFALSGRLAGLAPSSLLLLADILPTGVFAALQALQHPKIAPIVTGKAYPFGGFSLGGVLAPGDNGVALQKEDRTLTVGIVGLGPVGVCATVSLLDMLSRLEAEQGVAFRVVAIDLVESRRAKMQAVYDTIDASGKGSGRFAVASPEDGKQLVKDWTAGVGCNAVLEVVGNNSALTLAYDLVRPFGVVSSVGVHQAPPLPFTGREMYDKNVSVDFGRCPVRAVFPPALELLLRRQDVFGGVGGAASLIDRVVGLDAAPESYALFDKGGCGKVLFDPWV